MVRVSEKYRLGVTQASLDFVDVDVRGDVPLFVDPKAIRIQRGDWAESCQALLQSFFEELLKAIQGGDKTRIAALVLHLDEPNETHLGVSKGESRGRGLGGGKKSRELVDALAASRAGKSGLLEDLEETALFVAGVGRDIISDITTNIIRGPLISYTQAMCRFYGIPMEEQHSGFVWDDGTRSWREGFTDLPRGDSDKLILVPRSIVRLTSITDTGRYYRGYIRPYFEDIELNDPQSQLVQTLKGGRKKVRLGDLDEMLGTDKPSLVDHTERFPAALSEYRKSITSATNPPLDHEVFEENLGAERVDFRELLDAVKAISPGRAGAHHYHRAVADLLNALFDASLGNQEIEAPLHDKRKKIDIRYDNIAGAGFFRWLSLNYDAATVPVECKNYFDDPKNPELDQLAGRFSPQRGRVGMLVCRSLEDRPTLMLRCKDTANDHRGYILVLTDEDLEVMVEHAETTRGKSFETRTAFPLLWDQFRTLIS